MALSIKRAPGSGPVRQCLGVIGYALEIRCKTPDLRRGLAVETSHIPITVTNAVPKAT